MNKVSVKKGEVLNLSGQYFPEGVNDPADLTGITLTAFVKTQMLVKKAEFNIIKATNNIDFSMYLPTENLVAGKYLCDLKMLRNIDNIAVFSETFVIEVVQSITV